MNIYDIAFAVIGAMEEKQVDYVLVGGLATMYYSFARTTIDVDLVINLQDQQRLPEIAARLGPQFVLDPQCRFEIYSGKPYRTVRVADLGYDVDFFLSSADPFDRSQFARRQRVSILGHGVFLTTAEDILVMKLRWQRKKDMVDVDNIIGVQGDKLDWPYIEHWCDLHGTRVAMEKARSEIPPVPEE